MRYVLASLLLVFAMPIAANTLHTLSVTGAPGTTYDIVAGGIWPGLCWNGNPQVPPMTVHHADKQVTIHVGTREPLLCFSVLADWRGVVSFEPRDDGYYNVEVRYVDVMDEFVIGTARVFLVDRATIFRNRFD